MTKKANKQHAKRTIARSAVTQGIGWEEWWFALREIAGMFGEYIADEDAWREEFGKDLTAAQAFYIEYPEHRT